jgi:predicted ATPase
LNGLYTVYFLRDEIRPAYDLAEQLLLRAQSAHDPALLLLAYEALGQTSHQKGELLRAKEQLEMAVSFYDRERHRPLAFLIGFDPEVACLSYGSWTLWYLGYPDQALKMGDEALALAQGLSHPHTLAFAQFFFCFLRQFRREARAAQEIAERVIALSAEQGLHEEGIVEMQEGLAAIRVTGSVLGWPDFLCLLAEVCRETGRFDDGLSAVAEALPFADEHEDRVAEAETHRLKGELLLKQNNSNAAEPQSCFEQAIEIARHQSAKSWELRATTSLARLLAKRGRRDEARAMLAEIYGWFTEGFDTADLKDAKALLDELSG